MTSSGRTPFGLIVSSSGMQRGCTILMTLPALLARVIGAPPERKLPPAVQELAAAIIGKSPAEARKIFIDRLGPAPRDVGSGFRIEQWDIAGGIITFHQATGPVFFNPATRERTRLIKTTNPARINLLAGYEMTTESIPDANGTRYWLGNLHFTERDGLIAYEFVDSEQHAAIRKQLPPIFFLQHPKGTAILRYRDGVQADTLLESLEGTPVIADFDFLAANGTDRATYSIESSESDRSLAFTGKPAPPFRLNASWQSYWR